MTRMKKQFENQLFAVTGAASGIGAAAATLLKERGARVIALDLQEPDRQAADEFIAFDQGDFSSISELSQKIPSHINGLLNIAGAPPSARLNPATLLAINFYGLRTLTQRLRAHLAPGAAIVNMSSHAGHRWRENSDLIKHFLPATDLGGIKRLARRHEITIDGLGNRSAYPLSKQLVNFWTAASFPEFEKSGLRMNAVASAAVKTPILDDFLTSFGADSAARIRSLGVAPPEAIAKSLLFLVSEESAWIKGAIIPVDGGAGAHSIAKSLE